MQSIKGRLKRLETTANAPSIFPEFTAELDDGTIKKYVGCVWLGDYDRIVRVWVDPKHQPSCDEVGLLLAFSPSIEVLEAK